MPTVQSVHYGAAAPPGSAGRTLLVAAVAPLVLGYVGIAAVLALVTATASGASLSTSGVVRAAAPAWLVVYHVPVTVGGHELGMLPLLPTALMLAVVGRSAGNTARRLEWDTPRSAAKVIGAVGGVHAVFAALLALWHGTVSASPVGAFFGAGVFAAVAATAGTARDCGLLDAVLNRADDATVAGLRAGRLAVVGLVGVASLVFACGLLASWSTAVGMFHAIASGTGSGLGLFLLSVAYLPNALVGALSFAAGPGFAIGHLTLAQWHFHAGPVPGVPVLAPVPSVEAHWWVFLMLLPAATGVLVGLRCRSSPARVRSVGVAALIAGLTWLVLAALAGGALAGGPFDPVTVPAGLLGVAVFALVAVPGVLTIWLAGRISEELIVEQEDDPEDEELEHPEEEESAEGSPETDASHDDGRNGDGWDDDGRDDDDGEVTPDTVQAGHSPADGTA
jgi:hypothetical protein